ncbi:MAG: hypothetical protein OXI87_12120 [Albidovulum sp.]|nr:hypothetical protein [Albidovulum sp.]MDE0533672.1 hypothetical protein [Albidovulum sp.]
MRKESTSLSVPIESGLFPDEDNRSAVPLPEGRYQAISQRHLDRIPMLSELSEDERFAIRVVSSVLPFRTNRYVNDNLIDWDKVPKDPVYQLVFPQRAMLSDDDFQTVADHILRGSPDHEISRIAAEIRNNLNPHPAGQLEFNIPKIDGEAVNGLQHKYRETVLFFPSHGQTCHAYCTFCFRWAQFVGDSKMRIAASQNSGLHRYLASHPDISDLLVTGGDPMIMRTSWLERILRPFIGNRMLEHIQNIRIGTKALTFWPHRFVGDQDADELLRLLEDLVDAGKHVAIMAHFNHGQELRTEVVRDAIRRIRDTGAEIRCQAPLLAHINDCPAIWSRMWEKQVRLGMVPYYMFVERDTGARHYFEVPLARGWEIYAEAVRQVSGLGRTVRGPSMSATPGKVEVLGIQEIHGEKVFVLRFLQGRNPEWVAKPFFAKFDPAATWFDHLKPALGQSKFFFEDEFRAMTGNKIALAA